MEIPKLDPRVIKTQKKLKSTFLTILKHREFSSITVRELTKEAGIGFKTFYRHYSSLEEFVTIIILDELEIDNSIVDKNISKVDLIQKGINLINLIDRNFKLYQLLKYGRITQEIVPILRKWTSIGARNLLEDFTMDPVIQDLVTNHIVYAVIGLITWRADNIDSHSTEEMGKIYYELIIHSTQCFIESIK